MNNLILNEATLHYVARFLERWADKSPNKEHMKMTEEVRKISDHMIENLYQPMFVTVIRARKDK